MQAAEGAVSRCGAPGCLCCVAALLRGILQKQSSKNALFSRGLKQTSVDLANYHKPEPISVSYESKETRLDNKSNSITNQLQFHPSILMFEKFP